MALTNGFYNSVKGDRKYDAMQFSEIIDTLIIDGIIPSKGQLFAVTTTGNGMQINVGTGMAWFFHSWTKNDSVMVLTVEASDITRPRIDAVVLEVNREDNVRANSIKIVKGEANVNAEKPTLVNSEKVRQYPLAWITVPAASETVLAENIENNVGLTPTVFATGVLDTVPLDDLWNQWEGEWDTWFAAIKLQLSGDVVANLQGQIEELKEAANINVSEIVQNLYNVDGNVDAVLQNIYSRMTLIMGNKASVSVTVTCNSIPISGCIVQGLLLADGSTAITNTNGIASGYMAEGNTTLTISNFIDLKSFSQAYSITKGQTYHFDISLTPSSTITIQKTGTIYFSNYSSEFDACLVGGGGGGAGLIKSEKPYFSNTTVAPGGGGGYTTNKLNIILSASNRSFQCTIGAGGNSGYNRFMKDNKWSDDQLTQYVINNTFGKNGGSTSLSQNGQNIAVAAGATGAGNNGNSYTYVKYAGVGSGDGGDYINQDMGRIAGHSSTVYLFNETALGLAGGGGGAAGYGGEIKGGAPYGCNSRSMHTSTNPVPTGFGGGGGGAAGQSVTNVGASSGYQGCIYIRSRR